MEHSTLDLHRLLSSRNANDKIYRCDIRRYFGLDLPSKKVDELQEKLMELSEIQEIIDGKAN